MSGATMRAAVVSSPTHFELRDVAVPECAPDELRVRVEACGICGSDLHLRSSMPKGHTPGHEMAGVVDAVGGQVTDRAVGERVVIEPLRSCGTCEYCRSGRDSICPDLELYGIHRAGGMAEYISVPASRAFRVDDDLAPELAALAEPVAVAVHGLKRGGLSSGQRVLVLGAGAIGQLVLSCARALGAGDVQITARYPQQAELARGLGASRVLTEDEATLEELTARGRSSRFDLVVETVGGRADTLRAACAAARPGGVVSVLGVFVGPACLDPFPPLQKELDLRWANCYHRTPDGPADFELACRFLSSERVALARLITHQLPLDQIERAFEIASDKSSGALKVCIRPATVRS